jgi:carbon storage regulator
LGQNLENFAASPAMEGERMLVLTRKTGERIVIENGVNVTVLSVEGRRVCLGIDAPESISILRSELLDGIREPRRSGRSKRPRLVLHN